MSWEMQAVVAKLNHDISDTEKWVLTILVSFTDKQGKNGYPSVPTVADIGRVTDRTVRRVRARFFRTGVLKKVGRSKTIKYDFDPVRALELHYVEPEEADSVSGMDRKKAERVTGYSVGPPVTDSAKADSQSENADSKSGNPLKEPCKYPKDGPTSASNGDCSPACAHWRESRSAMVEMFGEEQVKAFLDPLVVGADDGQVVDLWCPTRFWMDFVERKFREGLERILKRRVNVVLKDVASVAKLKRLAKERTR